MVSVIVQSAAAFYLLWLAVSITVKNTVSAVVFKYTPSVLGVLVMLCAFDVI